MRHLSQNELNEIIAREKPGFRLASSARSSDRQAAIDRSTTADAGTPSAAVLQQRAHEKRQQLAQDRESSVNAQPKPQRSPLRDLFLDPDDYVGTGSLAEAELDPVSDGPSGLDADDDVEDAIVAVQPVNDLDAPFDAAVHQPKAVVVSGKERKITSAQG